MADVFQAKLSSYLVSPRKARLVAGLIRGRKVSTALDILRLTTKKTAPVMAKLVESALANAENKATVDVDRLYVAEVLVDGAGMWKRFMPRAQGRAFTVRKRLSHIIVRLKEK